MNKYVTAKTLAQVLELTERRVNQLVDEKIIEKEKNGKFAISKCVHDYYKYKFYPDEKDMLNTEKAMHEKIKREMAEIRLAQLKGQIHLAENVEQVITNMLVVFRNRILSIPAKVAPELLGLKTIAAVSDTLKHELCDALTELSEYDPEMFADNEGDEIEEDDTVIQEDTQSGGAAAETDG